MNVYTVHIPSPAATDAHPAERAQLVKEGFSWGAFLLGPLWLVAGGLWITALAWLAVAALAFAGFFFRLYTGGALAGLLFLLCLISGLEGFNLVRRRLVRVGLDLQGVVAGADRESAEYRAFGHSWPGQARIVPAGPAPQAPRTRYAVPLVGVFPAEEVRR